MRTGDPTPFRATTCSLSGGGPVGPAASVPWGQAECLKDSAEATQARLVPFGHFVQNGSQIELRQPHSQRFQHARQNRAAAGAAETETATGLVRPPILSGVAQGLLADVVRADDAGHGDEREQFVTVPSSRTSSAAWLK